MKILLVSPWQIPCGIAEYAAYLVDAVQQADARIQFRVTNNPTPADLSWAQLVHLNHQQAVGAPFVGLRPACPLVVTQHDTFETWAVMQERSFADFRAADALILHEPVEGLTGDRVFCWRQGIPSPELPSPLVVVRDDQVLPVLGTVGFPFPWKQYDLLAEATRQAGWALLLIATGATPEQIAGWKTLNPWTRVHAEFVERRRVVSLLSGCDATAFMYGPCGSGTSGAIRQGLAARKPIFCTASRQFRDLLEDPEAAEALRVIPGNAPALAEALKTLDDSRLLEDGTDLAVRRLAVTDSWIHRGHQHAALYRRLLEVA